jgi:hypothetical protein
MSAGNDTAVVETTEGGDAEVTVTEDAAEGPAAEGAADGAAATDAAATTTEAGGEDATTTVVEGEGATTVTVEPEGDAAATSDAAATEGAAATGDAAATAATRPWPTMPSRATGADETTTRWAPPSPATETTATEAKRPSGRRP